MRKVGRSRLRGESNMISTWLPLQEAILHLLGIDRQNLTYTYAGRDFRLTDVFGNVAYKVVA